MPARSCTILSTPTQQARALATVRHKLAKAHDEACVTGCDGMMADADSAGEKLVVCACAGSMQAPTVPGKEKQNYPDVKWGKGSDADLLYAASLDGCIDVYKLG